MSVFRPGRDVAVLGEPDNQDLSDEWDGYHALVSGRKPFATAAPESGEGYMLALDGVAWKPTALEVHLTIGGTGLSTGETLGGQSGSPILDRKGRAVRWSRWAVRPQATECGSRWNAGTAQPILKLALRLGCFERRRSTRAR